MTSSKESWLTIEVACDKAMLDAIAWFFSEHGADGAVVDDEHPDHATVTVYLPEGIWEKIKHQLDRFQQDLAVSFPDCPEPRVRASPLEWENWAVIWQDHFESIAIGQSLLVTPPWLQPEAKDRHVVVIEPAEAFGTGTHETTQACLVLLEELVIDHAVDPERSWLLDIGCGSGILSIAAGKLGFARVVGIDPDPLAIASAQRNARLNALQQEVDWRLAGLEDVEGQWDVVMANLDPGTLRWHSDRLAGLARSHLIVSGIPVERWSQMATVFRASGLVPQREIHASEWSGARFVHTG